MTSKLLLNELPTVGLSNLQSCCGMVRFCPECGGELTYDPILKHNICKSCGLTFTPQQLMDARDEILDRQETSFDQRKKRQKEYLKWWLSKKD